MRRLFEMLDSQDGTIREVAIELILVLVHYGSFVLSDCYLTRYVDVFAEDIRAAILEADMISVLATMSENPDMQQNLAPFISELSKRGVCSRSFPLSFHSHGHCRRGPS